MIDGFTGALLEPADPDYDGARSLWDAMIDKRPAVIARCRSTTDVVTALAYARKEGLEVAVRGGGHSVPGLSSTDRGMMIDLRPMNGVVVDPDARRARVQGGALLRDLDRETHEHGLATTGGMMHHTGVAGRLCERSQHRRERTRRRGLRVDEARTTRGAEGPVGPKEHTAPEREHLAPSGPEPPDPRLR